MQHVSAGDVCEGFPSFPPPLHVRKLVNSETLRRLGLVNDDWKFRSQYTRNRGFVQHSQYCTVGSAASSRLDTFTNYPVQRSTVLHQYCRPQLVRDLESNTGTFTSGLCRKYQRYRCGLKLVVWSAVTYNGGEGGSCWSGR